MTLRQWWRNLNAAAHELDAEALRESAVESGSEVIENVISGQLTTLYGTLHSLVFNPETSVPTFRAELFDGSGVVQLVWLGRRKIRGLYPGVRLSAEGRLVLVDDKLVMYNPKYRVIARAGEGE
jgi:hypothetical protein